MLVFDLLWVYYAIFKDLNQLEECSVWIFHCKLLMTYVESEYTLVPRPRKTKRQSYSNYTVKGFEFQNTHVNSGN